MRAVGAAAFTLSLSVAAATAAAPPRDAIRAEVRVVGPIVAGQPIQLYAGLRNLGKSDIVFVPRPESADWITYSYSVDNGPNNGRVGKPVTGGGTPLDEGQNWCPNNSRPLLLPASSRVMKLHQVKLPPGFTGKVTLEISVRVLQVDPNLACGPAHYLLATTQQTVEVPAPPAGK